MGPHERLLVARAFLIFVFLLGVSLFFWATGQKRRARRMKNLSFKREAYLPDDFDMEKFKKAVEESARKFPSETQRTGGVIFPTCSFCGGRLDTVSGGVISYRCAHCGRTSLSDSPLIG